VDRINRRMNRRGVIGQTIASIPVMLVIFLVMGIFVAGSILMKNIKKPENEMPTSYSDLELNKGNFLFNTIKMKNEGYMIIDGVYLLNMKNPYLQIDAVNDFFAGVSDLVMKEGDCLYLDSDKGKDGNWAFKSNRGVAFRRYADGMECSQTRISFGKLSSDKMKELTKKGICQINLNDLQNYLPLSDNFVWEIEGKQVNISYYNGKCLEGTS